MAERVGFVGLGVMGGPMAGHLIQAGHPVTVFNRTVSKTEPYAAMGAKVAESMADLGEECSVIFMCVSRTEDVRFCVEAMLERAAPGTLFVDHSTISPEGAKEIAHIAEMHSCAFVDAPVTGGSVGAQLGKLTVFCGGTEEAVARAIPLINAFAKRAERVGPVGAGQMTKLANQIAVGGALIALCESLSFAKKAGLDVALTHDLLSGGAGGSWAFDNYGPKILAEDWTPGFSVKNQRKDFGYCINAAQSINAAVPGTLLVNRLLARLEMEGHEDWTTAALYKSMLEMHAE